MIKQNPFSSYDFLGYLIPGAIFIYIFAFIDELKDSNHLGFRYLIQYISSLEYQKIIIFVIFSYLIGHILSFVSSITIEKYAIWTYGYPSKYLLKIKSPNYWTKWSLKTFKYNLWKIFLYLILAPIVILDKLIGNFLGFKTFYQKGLDPLLINLIKYKIVNLLLKLGMTEDQAKIFDPEKHDFQRIISHYTFENSKNHQFRLVNYVSLYGFLRNLALILNLLAIYLLIHIIAFSNFTLNNIMIISLLSVLSYISFMAFMKFFRRYTLEGMMLIVVDEDLSD